MAKGPLVTDAVESLIAGVYNKHPKWKAREIRNEVSLFLRKDNPKLPAKWPSLSSVQKVLAKARKRANELSPEEKPWRLGTLDQYPIPPEAVPSVLKLWKHRLWERKAGFTIREAKWAARLSVLLGDMVDLSFMASLYANTEQAYQLIDRPFNSAVLDKVLMDLVAGEVRVTPDGKGYTRITGQDIREKYAPVSKEESEQEYARITEGFKKEGKSK